MPEIEQTYAPRDTVEVFQDRNGEWRWRRKAGNREVIATCGEGYVSKAHCEEMAVHVNGTGVRLVRLEGMQG